MQSLDYEAFYQALTPLERDIRDKLARATRSYKNIVKDSRLGNVKQLSKDIADLRDLAAALGDLSDELQSKTDNFDTQAYFESGDFTRQMIEQCRQMNVDIEGEGGTYEMFPFKIRIDAENQDIYVNRKKVHCVRPLQFAQDMKQQVEKYTKSGFNLTQFANELAAAYDLTEVVRNHKKEAPRYGADVFLKDIYAYLAPTGKAQREYDMQQYAFDLARLYMSEEADIVRGGRKFTFGTTKQTGKFIRILDANGAEQFLGTIRFYH